MRPLSIRQRIFFGLVFLGTVFTCAFSLTIVLSAEHLEKSYIAYAYQEELEKINREYESNKYLPKSHHTIAFLASQNNVPEHFLDYQPGSYHEVELNNKEYHLFVNTLKDDKLYIAFDISLIEEYEYNLIIIITSLTITGIIASVIAGFWLTGFIARPVTDLASSIKRLSPQDTHLLERTNDVDLRIIEQAIDHYLERLSQHIKHEKQFSGITSHELRTPISTILATAETLLENTQLDTNTNERIKRIHRSALDMQYVSESLLQLIKYTPEKTEHVTAWPLADFLRDLVNEYQLLVRNDAILLNFEQHQQAYSSIKPEVIKLIIGNLIRNALQNTRKGHVKVELFEDKIIVSDTGIGMPENMITSFNNSDDTNTNENSGLGLLIVSRLCRQIDWEIQISNQTPDGLRIEIYMKR